MEWDHQGRYEISQEIHHKQEQKEDEIFHTASGTILDKKRQKKMKITKRVQLNFQ